ncbi:cupin domain-containing protein [Streptomyces niveus]|uniref:cupin domain-containing protein n=1 Tax=Streptomyces niveus TaxID=193462 RepID=UPI003421F8B3
MTDTLITGTGRFRITSLRSLHDEFEGLRKGTEGIGHHPGIAVYPVLWSSPRDGSPATPKEAFVHFAAGSRYPVLDRHDHSGEILIVVDGELDDGVRIHRPGTLIYSPRGSSHRPGSRQGCLVYIFFPDL